MKNAFILSNIKLKISKTTPGQFAQLAKTDNRVVDFLERFGDDMGYVLEKTPGMLILSCVILIAMTKNINPAGYVGWMKNRIRTICETTGWIILEPLLGNTVYPLLSTMQSFSSYCSAKHDIRKEMFITLLSVANSPSKYTISNCCCINMMQGTEISHINLIDRMILSKYREFIYLNSMKGLQQVMGDAR